MNSISSIKGCPIREYSARPVSCHVTESFRRYPPPFIASRCLDIQSKPFFVWRISQKSEKITGGDKRTRTAYICCARAALYQMSYTPCLFSCRKRLNLFEIEDFIPKAKKSSMPMNQQAHDMNLICRKQIKEEDFIIAPSYYTTMNLPKAKSYAEGRFIHRRHRNLQFQRNRNLMKLLLYKNKY